MSSLKKIRACNDYGFVPFWFWNGDQDEREIRRQIQLAAEAGLNGLAIHAREGNKTPYLSGKWLKLVEAACDEAEKTNLKIWIYDEEGYPSGTAGNKVQDNKPELCQQYLSYGYFKTNEIKLMKDVVAVFDAKSCRYCPTPTDCSSQKKHLIFQKKHISRYVDTLNPETARRFIKLTHEKYKKKLGKYFGKTITFFYTDDVNFHMEGYKGLPWTDNIDSEFQRQTGYSLIQNLSALVENTPDSEKMRIAYYRLLLDMFLSNFVEPLYQWCRENKVKFTGHLRGDEGPLARSIIQFGSAMPFFEHEDVPGIDDYLLRLIDCRYLKHVKNSIGLYPIPTYKFATSTANQLKDGKCGAEVMTSCGWGYSLAEQNAQLLFESNMGVNIFTPHDFSYATGGVAKKDHPPSYFFQQPYWPLWKEFHAKFSRISKTLTRGKRYANVLLLYPESQTWAMMDGESVDPSFKCRLSQSRSIKRIEAFEKNFANICMRLVKRHIGFDIGSERTLEGHGSIISGKLHIGEMSYGHVIMPSKSAISPKTEKLISAFRATGGKVINSFDEINKLEKDIYIEGETNETAVHTRLNADKKEFFISNHSPHHVKTIIPAEYSQYDRYDPETDRILDKAEKRIIKIPPFAGIHLAPQGRLKAKKLILSKTLFANLSRSKEVEISNWEIKRDGENIMLLDICILNENHVLLSDLAGKQTCEDLLFKIKTTKNAFPKRLLGENLHRLDIIVNGTRVATQRNGEFPGTRCIESADIAKHIVLGENLIKIGNKHSISNTEIFYLTGDFSVFKRKTDQNFDIAAISRAKRLRLGNLASQGMPFYWGTATYRAELPDLQGSYSWIDCGKTEGAIEIFINDKKIGSRLYPPYRIYIGDHKANKGAKIEIKLYNTAQNFFGPHRMKNLNTVLGWHDAHLDHKMLNVKPFGIYGPIRLLSDPVK